MSRSLTAEDARESLNAHIAAKGREIHQKYGPHIGWTQLTRLLEDRACVRYPCEILFDASVLQPGEFAHPVARSVRPEDGFVMHVHPSFELQLDSVAFPVLYQLVLVNYGEFASAEDALAFGAGALGLPPEKYYEALCQIADRLAETPSSGIPPGCRCVTSAPKG
jgi:hypothetical protein